MHAALHVSIRAGHCLGRLLTIRTHFCVVGLGSFRFGQRMPSEACRVLLHTASFARPYCTLMH